MASTAQQRQHGHPVPHLLEPEGCVRGGTMDPMTDEEAEDAANEAAEDERKKWDKRTG
jgi:hypothetical protein